MKQFYKFIFFCAIFLFQCIFLIEYIIQSIIEKMGNEQTIIKYSNKQQYIGNAKDSIPQGKGKLLLKNKTLFEGAFSDGKLVEGRLTTNIYAYQGSLKQNQIHGNGMLVDKSNTLYKGVFQKGRFRNGTITKKDEKDEAIYHFSGEIQKQQLFLNGKGQLKYELQQGNEAQRTNRCLEGQFFKGNIHGIGKYTLSNKDYYEGSFYNGKKQGEGIYVSQNFTLKGQFQNDNCVGIAEISFKNGDKYKGNIKDFKMHGKGTYQYSNGMKYQGDFYEGTQWGLCTIAFPSGNEIQKYEGQISEGNFNGIGILYYANGVIFKGNFNNGNNHGYGVYIYGQLKYKCLYLMNSLVGELKIMS